MKLLLLIFVAFTLPYAALWHNKSVGSDRDGSNADQPNNSGAGTKRDG